MRTLILSVENHEGLGKCWMCEEKGECESMLIEIFGTNKIPTYFTAEARSDQVKARIEALNPDANVIVKINENCCICNAKGVDDVFYFCDSCREESDKQQDSLKANEIMKLNKIYTYYNGNEFCAAKGEFKISEDSHVLICFGSSEPIAIQNLMKKIHPEIKITVKDCKYYLDNNKITRTIK